MPSALRISEAASLGLHAMGLLASDAGRSLSTRAIASTLRVSEAHLSKVLQRLVKMGLLVSSRGPRGGFTLAQKPASITLLEVYEATEGPVTPAGCVFDLADCDGVHCVLGDVLSQANQQFLDYLSRTTLSEISPVFQQERFKSAE